MVEAAQVAGEIVSRSRVGLCDRAARQWRVRPGMRLHVPTVPLCTFLYGRFWRPLFKVVEHKKKWVKCNKKGS